MRCEVCGADRGEGGACVRCGHPALAAEASRALAEAADLLREGSVDQAIRRVQQAVKAAPEAWLPHLKLAALYERKADAGESTLLRLADREFTEAVKLGPLEREPHVARLGLAARLGRLPFLKAEYERRRDDLPFAADCLRMIAALELAKPAPATGDLRFPNTPPRILLLGGGIGLMLGLALLSVVTWGSVNDQSSSLLAQPGLYLSIVLLTGAAVLLLEGWRGKRAQDQT